MKTIFNTRVAALAIAALSVSFGSHALFAHDMSAADAATAQPGTAGMMMGASPMANMSSGMGGMMAMMSSGTCPMMGGNALSAQPMSMMPQMHQQMPATATPSR